MNNSINYLRSVGAIFMGFIVQAIISSIGVRLILIFFFPPVPPNTIPVMTTSQSLMLLAMNMLAGLTGGYVTAAAAGIARVLHAAILAGLLCAIGLLALVVRKDFNSYSYYVMATTSLGLILGAWLQSQRRKSVSV